MPIPEITLKVIGNIADEKDEIYRDYLYSIDDIFTLYSVYINQNEVAVCNIKRTENGYELIEKKLENPNGTH